LQLYVGAGNLPDDGGYGAKVLGERSRLQIAAAGRVDAAIAAGRAASAPADPKPSTQAGVQTIGAAPVSEADRVQVSTDQAS
jgi:hypothetical protein